MNFFTAEVAKKEEVIACLMLFDGGPKTCLAIKARGGKYIWMYEDGEISIQSEAFNPKDKDVIQTFRKGDSVTITF